MASLLLLPPYIQHAWVYASNIRSDTVIGFQFYSISVINRGKINETEAIKPTLNGQFVQMQHYK